jgi:hypothetical protein
MERARHHRKGGALRGVVAYRRLNRFQAALPLNQKRELWLPLHTASVSSFASPRLTALGGCPPRTAISLSWCGNINLLPFRQSAMMLEPGGNNTRIALVCDGFRQCLRID